MRMCISPRAYLGQRADQPRQSLLQNPSTSWPERHRMYIPKGHLLHLASLRSLTGLRNLALGGLPELAGVTPPCAWGVAGEAVAVQESGAVAAVVVESSRCIHSLVHVSWGQVPGSCNVLGRHSMHVAHAVSHGGFWGLPSKKIMGILQRRTSQSTRSTIWLHQGESCACQAILRTASPIADLYLVSLMQLTCHGAWLKVNPKSHHHQDKT